MQNFARPAFALFLLSLSLTATAIAAGGDSDNDGIPDGQDNCLEHANPTQLDTNADGLGNACDPDLNNDGTVDFPDLNALKLAFFSAPADANWDPDADFDGSGVVDFPDLNLMKLFFFKPPGPTGFSTWVNPAGGDWNEAANWFPVTVPSAATAVVINVGGGITVTHASGDTVVAGLIANDRLAITGGSLEVTGNMQVTALEVDGATLRNSHIRPTTGGGEVTVSSAATLDGLTLAADMTLTNGVQVTVLNDLVLDGATLTIASDGSFSSLRFAGTQALAGTGVLQFGGTTSSDVVNRAYGDAGDVLTVEAGVEVRTATAGGSLGIAGAGRGLVVAGNLVSSVPGRTFHVIGDALAFEGAASGVAGGDFRFDGTWSGTAASTIAVSEGGELELFGTFTTAGAVTVTDGLLDIGSNATTIWANTGTIDLAASDAELGGAFSVADLGTFSTADTVTLDGTLNNTGVSVDFDLLPGAWQLGSGTIVGGTVGGELAVVATGTIEGIVFTGLATIENARTLNVENGLTLDGSITLASGGSFTTLSFVGSQTLDGVGEVRYAGTTGSNATNRVWCSTGNVLTVGPGITARTVTAGGDFGGIGTRGLTFGGTLISDVPGRRLRLIGDPLLVTGSVSGVNGGDVALAGNWTASPASSVSVVGGGTLELVGDWLNQTTISVADGLLEIGVNDNDVWDNDGVLDLVNTDLVLDGTFAAADLGTLNTNGQVTLVGTLENTGGTFDIGALPGNWQFGTGGTVTGGTLSGSALAIDGAATFDAVTLSVDTTITNGKSLTVVNGMSLDNASVTIASDGSFTDLRVSGDSSIAGSGEIRFGGTASGSSVNRFYGNTANSVMTVGPGVTVRTLTGGGVVGVSAPGRAVNFQGSAISDLAGRELKLIGDTLDVSGSLLGSAGGNIEMAGDWTLTATGSIAVSGGGTLELFDNWLNQGAIAVTDGLLDVGRDDNDLWMNLGTIDLINANTELGGSFVIDDLGVFTTADLVTLDGDLDITGTTLDLDALPGTWELDAGRIIGGTLTGTGLAVVGSGVLDGITLGVDITIENSKRLTLTNGLVFDNSTISIASNGSFTDLIIEGTQTLSGSGEVLLSGTTGSDSVCRVMPGAATVATFGPGVAVRTDTSGGSVGSLAAGRAVILEGTLNAELPGRTVKFDGDTFTNTGLLVASAGGDFSTGTDYHQTSAGTVSVEIDGTDPADFSSVTVAINRTANLDGTLEIVLGSYAPVLGDSFQIMSFGSRNGTFSATNGTVLGGGLAFDVVYSDTDVVLEVVAAR